MTANKKKSKKKPVLIVLAVIAVIALAIGLWGYFKVSKTPGGDEDIRIYLFGDTDDDNLAERLKEYLPEEYVSSVMTAYNLLGGMDEGKHPVGSYVVSSDMPAYKLANIIRHHRQTPVKLKINYARTFGDVASQVDRQLMMDSVSFYQTADSIFSAKGYKRPQYSALVIPDTHEFYWTASPVEVVDRLYDSYENFWNGQRKEKAAKLNLSPVEISTLASIVESETAKSDEKPLVARLYLNRLKKGMKLQADPTVIFGIGDFTIRRVTGSHLRTPSPYNTYLNTGLPPGPIKVPSKEGLDAVLDAPAHDYIFMCAKEDFSGYHNFADNIKDHNENGRRYRAELNRRGIK